MQNLCSLKRIFILMLIITSANAGPVASKYKSE